MADEQIRAAIRGFIKAMAAGDGTLASSYLAPDVAWVQPGGGTQKGPAQIAANIARLKKAAPDFKVIENGMGVVVQGSIGVIEHDLSGTTNGKQWVVPATCIYEFKNDKIQSIRTFYDRLHQAKQAAKGMLQRWVVNSVVNAAEKPMR